MKQTRFVNESGENSRLGVEDHRKKKVGLGGRVKAKGDGIWKEGPPKAGDEVALEKDEEKNCGTVSFERWGQKHFISGTGLKRESSKSAGEVKAGPLVKPL